MAPQFHRGESVEIADIDDEMEGSYYSATVVTHLIRQDQYIVQCHNLMKDDKSGPLREIVTAAQIRPMPPEIPAVDFKISDAVDALHEDGWWVGKIKRKINNKKKKYVVYFETTGEEIAYGVDQLRVHQDWVNGNWISDFVKGNS